MEVEQLALLVDGKTRCGYCGRELEESGTRPGLYECGRCAPRLREIRTLGEWAAWIKENANAVRIS